MNRIARLRERLEEPLLVTNLINVRYLCGFDSSNAALLVDRDGVTLFTDFRYIDEARAVEDVDVVQTRRALIQELAATLKGRIAFETALPYEQYQALAAGGLELVPRDGLVEGLRAVKDESELALLRRACAITDLVYERLMDVRFIGRREREVAWDLAGLFHDEGAESFAFEFIVGSGPTGSHPHGRAGDRKIGTGELVVIDAGCTIGGYSSDYTRTFSTGPLGERERQAYEVVALAQDAALGGIRAGMTGVEADRLARAIVDESDFHGLMGHGLGHGLGLDVHEAPRLSTESTDVLEAGNVVTVEPGVYVSGEFGIRIEDDVVVTADGIENLTGFRNDLVEVG
ncbi:MAG TPA: Xaa-Pro peptidase family protein [Gaiellaceae bacterium]|nr:Xaa-Pro peptidase family protein [Gaiellaceae bacterium]